MAVFWGTYTNKVDRKGRVSVPAAFRKPLMGVEFQGVLVFPALHSPALEGRSWEQMGKLSDGISGLPEFSPERDTLAAAIFGGSVPLPFDPEGRINLPEGLVAQVGIVGEAAFVGMGTSFQIWEPKALAQFQEEARARIRAEGLSLPIRKEGP
jgi:MraZ protein